MHFILVKWTKEEAMEPPISHNVSAEWSRGFMVSLYLVGSYGAGDRDRTGDIQLGKLTFCH